MPRKSPKKAEKLGSFPRHTEMTFSARLAEWINSIVEKEGLPFGRAEVEIKEPGKPQRADITLYRSPTSYKALCVIECKHPYENVYSATVIEQASSYARNFPAPYFATCNGRTLAWFDAKEQTITGGCMKSFSLAARLQLISDISNKARLEIQEGLRNFLFELYEHVYHQKTISLIEVNEFFILLLQTTIEQLFGYYIELVEKRVRQDQKFFRRVQDWFVVQGWTFTFQKQDFEIIARQTSYILINKIILYSALQQHWKNLDKLSVGKDVKRGGKLAYHLEGYFRDVLKVDYQTIFSTDELELGFPEDEHAVEVIRSLIENINRFNLAKLGYEIIGILFERLIPRAERHKLGQYFTPAEVVDLMLMCCSLQATDTVLDPAVGAGTFLVRAYQYKFLQTFMTTHEDILEHLWGCDIDPFPAHLAAINLAIRGLDSLANFPRILHRDFFRLTPDTLSFSRPLLTNTEDEFWMLEPDIPHQCEQAKSFDIIVGNPPYTRQEFLGDLMPVETYKGDLIQQVFLLPDGTQLPPFSKRAGLHAYFFVHAYKFLREGGRLAFVTSTSWLTADYGRDLQNFLLSHFKILTIMESDKESWFPELYVDNCIVVLEKCSGKAHLNDRQNNIVRFVRFRTPLVPTIVLPAEDEQSQRQRFNNLQRFVNYLFGVDQLVIQENIYIYPKRQGDLLNEGLDLNKDQYIGSRWNKFTLAPTIWQKLTNQAANRLIPLAHLADLQCGIRTGANDFFYLTEEEIHLHNIESEFWGVGSEHAFVPNVVMKSPVESETVFLDPNKLKLRALLFHAPPGTLAKTKAWSYIEAGERQGIHERSTFMSRSDKQKRFGWYDLGDVPKATILWPELSGARYKKKVFCSITPIIVNGKFYAVYPYNPRLQNLLVAVLNSTIVDFLSELESTFYGGRTGAPSELPLHQAKKLLVPDIRQFTPDQIKRIEDAFEHYKIRPIRPLWQEYGTANEEMLTLDTIAPDLREIDAIVMGEVLGLTEQEQLLIYQTLLTLSIQRTNKARDARKQQSSRIKRDLDEEAFISTVLHHASDNIEQVRHLYQSMLVNRETTVIEVISSTEKAFRGIPLLYEGLWGYELQLGPTTIAYPSSAYGEALYRQTWALIRMPQITMPVQINTMVSETSALKTALEHLIKTVDIHTSNILDLKDRRKISARLWAEIRQQITNPSENVHTAFWSHQEEIG